MSKAELKQETTGEWVVRDSRSGRFIEVRGANAMKSTPLPLNKNVDLTKPIAEQALKNRVAKPRKPAAKD